MTDGNLNARFDVTQQDEIGTLAVALSNMSDRLKAVIENIRQVSTTVATRSRDITEWAQMLSSGARSQAVDFEQASASMEQITATIQQNTARAQQTEGIATNAEKNAHQVREAVTKALQGMRDIADNISQT
ncbi:MAG: HAMP domain-containing protein, partial [bacterium]|nr:HAMP domain-containing protein [bacterium]